MSYERSLHAVSSSNGPTRTGNASHNGSNSRSGTTTLFTMWWLWRAGGVSSLSTGKRSNNEDQSAQLATTSLANILDLDLDFVAQLIRLTASHGRQEHPLAGDAALFLDIDMSILGAPSEVYREYVSGVTAEYAAVPRWLFRRKRRAFLRTLLATPRIYLTDLMEMRLGERARQNLAWELTGFPGELFRSNSA